VSADGVHITVAEAIERVCAGRMVIVVDDEDRENEGDLTMAADLITPEAVNFMATFGRGLICVALTEDRVVDLRLPMMTSDNRSTRGTAFTVSVDARRGITTGISARERAHTIQTLVGSGATADDLVTPGHVFPLRGRRGGVLVRSGHTEAAIDLARMADRKPAGVICEIMREDGEMARMPDLEAFAARHGLGIVRIADLIQYRLSRELLVHKVSQTAVTPGGSRVEYQAHLYGTDVEDTEYLALVLGDVTGAAPVLVRVQSANVLRDVLGTGGLVGGPPPTTWLRMIEEEKRGVLLYVFARGELSLARALGSPRRKPTGEETAPGAPGALPLPGSLLAGGERESPLRNFGLGAQVLVDLGLRAIRLLTDNPRRIAGLDGYGIQIVECVPSRPAATLVALERKEDAR
jgi:3,4-dihydroxy 2-butanone 4-phosphate synthase/GTP cyclohydrolase II